MKEILHLFGLLICSLLLNFNLFVGLSALFCYFYVLFRYEFILKSISNSNSIIILFFGFIFSDLISLMLLNAFGYQEVQTIYYQVVGVLFVSVYVVSDKALLRYFRILIPIFLLLLLFGILKERNVTSAIAYSKSLWLLPILCYQLLAKELVLSKSLRVFIITFFAFSVYLTLVQDLWGVENYLLGMGIDKFYANRGISDLGDVPIGFVVYDPISHTYDSRPFGVFLSPDKMAYMSAVGFCLLFSSALHTAKNYVVILLLLFCAIFTVSFDVKAVTLFFVIMCYVYFLDTVLNVGKFSTRFLLTVFPFTLSIILVVNVVPVNVLSSSGAIQHLWGLVNPVINSSFFSIDFWFGNGIGGGGTVGRVYADNNSASKADVGGESFIGSTFYQIGLLGIIILYILYKKIDLLARYKLTSRSYSLVSAGLISVLLSMSMSEAFVSFFQSTCIAIWLMSFTKFQNKSS